jgi:hypothetical protein
LGSRTGGTNELRQTVLNAIDVSELAMENDFVVNIDKGNLCTWRGRGGLDTKKCIQGVGYSFDLLDLEVLDGTKV